jgi:hypothetical protein
MDALFLWASDPPLPWDSDIKPLIDGYVGPTCFKVRNGASDVGVFDKKGNLVIAGTKHEHASTQVLADVSAPEFIIRDHSGANVLRVTNSGDVYLKGALYTDYDVSTITASGAFRIEDSRAACTSAGNLYIGGSLYEHGKP